jgi:hypothetical protein
MESESDARCLAFHSTPVLAAGEKTEAGTASAGTPAPEAKEKKICKTAEHSYTSRMRKRVCRTAEQWEASQRNKTTASELQRMGTR